MLKRFISYYKPHKKLFYIDMFCALLLSIIDLLFPTVTRLFMNQYIPEGNWGMMVKISIFLFALIGVRLACNYFVLFWGHVMGSRIEKDIRADLFKKFQSLNFNYYDENQTGKTMSRLVNDLREIAELSHHGPEDIFISIVLLIGTFILLCRINLTLTLVMFPLVILIFIFSFSIRKWMTRVSKKVKATQADINAQIESSISGVRLMKSFTNEDLEYQKFDLNNQKYYRSWFGFYNCMGIFHGGNNALIDVTNIVLLLFGGYLVMNSKMSLGDITAFILFLNYLINPIRRLIQFMEQFQAGMAGFERFCEVMDIEPEIVSPENEIILENTIGKISFKNVNFKYETSEQYILNNFDLVIEPGKKIALVGESGVGKTTISQLIPRFYEVSTGSIEIDDINIKDYDLHSLRSNIGHVQQDVFIFYDNIIENIRYGKPEATDEEVYEAARKANIHDFILTLEQGYQTQVGDRGIKLSGGQKQRVAIARVFLKNPRILILDEATSALDNITEAAIQSSLDELSKGRTTITIAHRLSTVQNADDIIVLGSEGIAERGTHQELIKQNGYYASLYKKAKTI
jgi:ABC-type multidrug transport system, ATPase and permease components